VRVRAEPTTDAEILAILETGTEMEVTGTSEQADDYQWYPVTLVVEGEELSGWVAADFVAPV
jgi:hypothetical protein